MLMSIQSAIDETILEAFAAPIIPYNCTKQVCGVNYQIRVLVFRFDNDGRAYAVYTYNGSSLASCRFLEEIPGWETLGQPSHCIQPECGQQQKDYLSDSDNDSDSFGQDFKAIDE